MAYVPGFSRDVFISYPMEALRWTKQFDKDLREELAQALSGKGLDTYFAGREFHLGQPSDEMLNEARKSALFLVILTPACFAEDESRFVAQEVKAFRESGSIANRVFPILLKPVSGRELSRLIPLENPLAFWNKLEFYYEEDGVPLTLQPHSEPPGEPSGAYNRKVEKVAWHLKNRLEEIARDRRDIANKKGPFAGITVVLAPKGLDPNIENEWHEIRKLLLNDGTTVLPDESSAGDQAEFEAAVRSAKVFVQVFTLDDMDRAKSQLNTVKAQGSVSILQWRKKNPKFDSAMLASLDQDDREFCEGAQTGLLEDFKVMIREKLEQIKNPGPKPPIRDKPLLYITVDHSDLPLVHKLLPAAVKMADVDVMTNEESRRAVEFEDALKESANQPTGLPLSSAAKEKYRSGALLRSRRGSHLWVTGDTLARGHRGDLRGVAR